MNLATVKEGQWKAIQPLWCTLGGLASQQKQNATHLAEAQYLRGHADHNGFSLKSYFSISKFHMGFTFYSHKMTTFHLIYYLHLYPYPNFKQNWHFQKMQRLSMASYTTWYTPVSSSSSSLTSKDTYVCSSLRSTAPSMWRAIGDHLVGEQSYRICILWKINTVVVGRNRRIRWWCFCLNTVEIHNLDKDGSYGNWRERKGKNKQFLLK